MRIKYTAISFRSIDKKGNKQTGKMIIIDGLVTATFSDKGFAKQLYEDQKKKGINVAYNDKLNATMQIYKGKTRKEIIEIERKELTGLNIKLKNIFF